MTEKKFTAIVSSSEELAKTRPACYKGKLWLLTLLGNLYLAAAAALLLALQALSLGVIALEMTEPGKGLLIVFGIIVLTWTSWAMLKPTLVRDEKLKPPTGIPLTPEQAPELFALTDALCSQANAPRIRRIVITDRFNAGVVKLPRLGLFGWQKSWLVLGLPLMKCLTAEQFKTVLAHELGHLTKGRGRAAHCIHQQILHWTDLAEILGGTGRRVFLFLPFLKWFVPYLAACSAPLARQNEYEADAVSARIVSVEAAAESLSASNVIDKYLQEQYWPQVLQLACRQPEPPAPYLTLGRNIAAEVDAVWAKHWLAQDMQLQTKPGDSHPMLQDRLKSLQAAPRIRLPEPGQSAERLLGSALQAVIERMDKEWQDKIRPWWTERYQRVQNSRRQLAELNARVAGGAVLTVEEAYQRAQLTWSIGRDEDATLKQLLALYHRAAEHPLASFGLGAWLLNRDCMPEDEYDAEDGYALLEQAMRLDEGFTARCCEMLRDYCWQNGREETAQHWHERLTERLLLEEAVKQERSQVLRTDQFEPHGLAEDVVARMRSALKNIPELRKAYLVRKRLQHSPQPPCYVLGYAVTAWFQFGTRRQDEQKMLQQIQAAVECPEELRIISMEGDNRRLRGKFSKVPEARLV